MSQAFSYLGRLILDYETTFKTDPASPNGLVLPFNSFKVSGARPKKTPGRITGSRNPAAPFEGRLAVAGEVTVPLDSIAFGYWLKGMFGAPTTTGASAPYSHLFKVGSTMPSMVLENRFSDPSAVLTYQKISGAMVSSLGLSLGSDDELVASIGIEAASESFGTVAYDSSPTTVTESKFLVEDMALSEGGSAIATVVSLDLVINLGLDPERGYTIGSEERSVIPVGMVGVTGKLIAFFDSMTLLSKALASTETSLAVSFTKSASESLTLTVNELVYERQTPPIEGPAGVLVELPFVAYLGNHSDASVIKAVLVNSQASYA